MKKNGTRKKRAYVELFCGCGGLSLGLESAGFQCLLANDVSPMAAETFAYNLVQGAREGVPPGPETLGGDYFNFLVEPTFNHSSEPDGKTYRNWKSYSADKESITAAAKKQLSSDKGTHLLVGDATLLADLIAERTPRRLKGVDLLAGGPPCQSFSLAGKREREHPRNQLFTSFVKITKALKPKVVLFENVLGITAPFKSVAGKKYHPWFEVCKAFRLEGYVPIPSLVDASLFGVPQTRMRFIMIALREDIARAHLKKADHVSPLSNAIELGLSNYAKQREWVQGDDQRLIFRPVSGISDWPEMLFPKPSHEEAVSVDEAISDIATAGEDITYEAAAYSRGLSKLLKYRDRTTSVRTVQNHKSRRHGYRAAARFRLMRMLAAKGWKAKSMSEVAADIERAKDLLDGKMLLSADSNELIKASKHNRKRVNRLLKQLASSKHAQRCLNKSKPAPAQLSIPDDYIHWKHDRVLTIREMARIQSFPDWFKFCSKETTGGDARAYEVPQYTQVGNAVPPLLGRSFGKSIYAFLDQIGS